SLVERPVWGREVVGSDPTAPMTRGQALAGLTPGYPSGERFLAADERYPDAAAQDSSCERADQVDPDVAPVLVVEHRVERTRRVEGSSRFGPHGRRGREDEEPDQERRHHSDPRGA